MNGHVSRREMLKIMAALAGGVGLVGVQRLLTSAASQAPVAGMTPQAYLPLLSRSVLAATPTQTHTPMPTPTRTPAPTATSITGTGPKVIHVHSPSATSWNFSSGWYSDYVNQSAVNNMIDRGVMALTNAATMADAWHAILPAYMPGEKVAIKINLNNAHCNDSHQIVDALPQPINSVIRGLKAIGVAESKILSRASRWRSIGDGQ